MDIKNLFPIERQEAIVNYINKNGRIRISDIQSMFLVGYETAKNDIISLEKEKKLDECMEGLYQLVLKKIIS